jgi:hypothetical protein
VALQRKKVKSRKEKKKKETRSSLLKFNINDKKKEIDVIEIGINDDIFIVKEPIMLLNEIQELMKQNAGIIREETNLKNGLKRILEFNK